MNIHYDKAYPFITYGIIRCILDYCLGIMAYLIYEQQNSRTAEQQLFFKLPYLYSAFYYTGK